jgi:hypothetical protein
MNPHNKHTECTKKIMNFFLKSPDVGLCGLVQEKPSKGGMKKLYVYRYNFIICIYKTKAA